MPNKDHEQRREAIRQSLLTGPAATQASLVAELTAKGYRATQSSVSRDLRELGAIKTSQGYELPLDTEGGDQQMAAVAELLRDMHPAGPTLLVVKTAIGAAQRVAATGRRSSATSVATTRYLSQPNPEFRKKT